MKKILVASFALMTTLPAHALVGGLIDSNAANSLWAGVGAVTVNGGTFSGALIGSRYVLTAAHVVGNAAPGNVSFTLNVGSAASQVIAAEAITVFSGYQGTSPGSDGVWHDDLALIRLAAPVNSSVPIYDLYSGPLGGQTLTLVGYGASGDGMGGGFVSANPNVKRVGQNRVDGLLVDDDGGTQDEVFIFDFDGPNTSSNVYGPATAPNLTLGAGIEAQFAGGDSGSPVFVNDNGVWKIAGIAAFNGATTGLPGSNVSYGAVGGGTIVAPYVPFIEENLSAPIPEADTYLLLLTGLGLVGFIAARRGKL